MPRLCHTIECPAGHKPKCTCGADEHNKEREVDRRLERLEKQAEKLEGVIKETLRSQISGRRALE